MKRKELKEYLNLQLNKYKNINWKIKILKNLILPS